jgi:hypothetical protein
MFEFSRPERRVLANSDLQRFESCRPSQPVPCDVGAALARTKVRHASFYNPRSR